MDARKGTEPPSSGAARNISRCEICLTPTKRSEHRACPSCWRWHEAGIMLARFVELTRGAK